MHADWRGDQLMAAAGPPMAVVVSDIVGDFAVVVAGSVAAGIVAAGIVAAGIVAAADTAGIVASDVVDIAGTLADFAAPRRRYSQLYSIAVPERLHLGSSGRKMNP